MTQRSLDANNMSLKSKRITILVADDHPLLRQSVRNVLDKEPDFQVIGEAGDGEEAVKLATDLEPDLVVMDIGMPKLDGIEATRQIKASRPDTIVLVLTIHDEDKYVLGILEAGAAGYLMKSVYGGELVQAVRGVVSGDAVLSHKIAQLLVRRAARYPTRPIKLQGPDKLSVKELTIIKLIACGMDNKAIAEELDLGLRTVKGHISTIISKLGVGSRIEIVIACLRAGFISIEDTK